MSDDINYKNNPLHGLSLKYLLIELVDHYGFEILFAYLNINCFKTNPSIESSIKFLKKTDWAREKVEAFYLYQFKSLPRASAEQFELPPRDRIIPDGQQPGEPAELSLEDAARLNEKRARKAAEHDRGRGAGRSKSPYGQGSGRDSSSPWKTRSDSHRADTGHGPAKSRTADKPAKSSARSADALADSDPWAKWKD